MYDKISDLLLDVGAVSLVPLVILKGIIWYTFEYIYNKFIKPFFNRFRHVHGGFVVRLSDLDLLISRVPEEQRKVAEALKKTLGIKPPPSSTTVKLSEIKQMLRNVSETYRKQAEKIIRILTAPSPSDVVIFGKDAHTGDVRYQILHNVKCKDLNNVAYNVTPTGHKQKIYIG